MAVETNFWVQDDDDDDVEVSAAPTDQLVALLGRSVSTGIVPLAFTIEQDLEPVAMSGLSVSWSPETIAVFRRIREEARSADSIFQHSLPYASLRGLIDASLDSVSRISRSVGLEKYDLDPARMDVEPFLYLESSEVASTQQTLQTLIENWMVLFLLPQYVDPGAVPYNLLDDLRALSRENEIVRIEPVTDRVLPWTSGPTGTATPPNRKRGYQLLVDQAARQAAGATLFRGLGPMRRIVIAGAHDQSKAHLITQPIQLGERGRFSLLVTLEVVTFPSLGQPLITMEVSKRRWLGRISDRTSDFGKISGNVFSSLRPERAVSFNVLRDRNQQSGEWEWMPDNAFEALKHALQLPLVRVDAHALLRGAANTTNSEICLIHRDSISDGRHKIKVGVPELDKLEAFENLTHALVPIGLVPFRNYAPVKTRHSNDYEESAKTINPSTLLSSALESLEPESAVSTSQAFLSGMDDAEIDQVLRRQFNLGLEQIQKSQRIVHFQNARGQDEKDQSAELELLIQANAAAVKRLYGELRPLLVIFHDEKYASALRIVKAVARLLWGDALEIQTNRLPVGAHGARGALAGSQKKERERFELRVDAWRPATTQLAAMKRRTFCLVMAADRYPDPNNSAIARRDDRINKTAGRQALATLAQASVQYLLPPNTAWNSDQIDLGDFLHRIQASLRDLVSAHSGRFDGVAQAVTRSFSAVPAMRESMPKEILAITVVRKTAGRARGGFGTTFLPLALRIDVSTGRCDARCAHEGRHADMVVTAWEPFVSALSTISRISPVRLADKMDTARTRFQRFTEQVISESVETDAQPLVLIDSSNCVQLWGWLADSRLDVGNIQIGEKQWMEKAWKGARIVRIRQNLAPGIVEDKQQHCAHSSVEDDRNANVLPSDEQLRAPTSRGGLFRMTSELGPSGAVCYLSVGKKTLHMGKRGPSCYQETLAALPYQSPEGGSKRVKNAAGIVLHRLGRRPAWHGQWPTPNPLEIVVTLRQPEDNPDQIAELVERLRYGFGHYADWTSLPAPLFFERVVRDYVSGFTLDEAADGEETDEGD